MHVHFAGSAGLSAVPAARARTRRRGSHLLVAVATFGLLSIGQAVAQEAEEAVVAPAPASARPAGNGKVCEYEDVTGSRMRKRVCYTPEQWQSRERAAKDAVREMDGKAIGERHEG